MQTSRSLSDAQRSGLARRIFNLSEKEPGIQTIAGTPEKKGKGCTPELKGRLAGEGARWRDRGAWP